MVMTRLETISTHYLILESKLSIGLDFYTFYVKLSVTSRSFLLKTNF